jgi:anti-sigma factor RsiW
METGIHELTAGYALDALEPGERSAYEAHLAGCEQCQQELSSFLETTEALAVAASGPAPSPALRERILAEVRAEAPQNVVSLEPRRQRRAAVPVLAAAAAIAAVVALAFGIRAADLSGQLDDSRAALDRAQSSAAVLADPGAQSVDLQAGDGRLVVDTDGRAVLVLDGLGPAPAGKTYEMWVVPGGEISRASSAGLFSGGGGREILPVEGTVRPGDVVAVTVEPAGGVAAPTTQPVVASDGV